MSNSINGTNGTNGMAAVMNGLMVGVDSMTPDALFSYCSARINGIDAQVKGAFAQQQRNNDIQGAIGDAIGCLNRAITGGTDGSNQWGRASIDFYWNAINKAGGPETPEGQKLLGQLKAFAGSMSKSGDNSMIDLVSDGAKWDAYKKANSSQLDRDLPGWGGIDHDKVDTAVKSLSSMNDELGKGGELEMIKLQSLMSQRQLAIQMTTNLIQTLNDSSKTIAGNLHG
jgi:hypothetical protein